MKTQESMGCKAPRYPSQGPGIKKYQTLFKKIEENYSCVNVTKDVI